MSDALVDVSRTGAVAVIALRRERKLNALSSALEAAIGEALDHPDVRGSACVVITGGPRAFSAGADVNELRDLDPAAIAAYYRDTGGVYERVARLPQPTISAIAGHCLGGGFELALATDFRIADTTASFGLPEVGIGILPSSGGTMRLTRLLGTARAKELILLGDKLGTEQARTLGLVTEVVPAGESLPRALALAERLAELPALALSMAKQVIDATPGASDEAALALERLAYTALAQTPEHGDATQSFGRTGSRPSAA
jgi:enoyl-CoA hydratase/carnithine racemase